MHEEHITQHEHNYEVTRYNPCLKSEALQFRHKVIFYFIYFPPEVSSMKYGWLGVFKKEYFRLITN